MTFLRDVQERTYVVADGVRATVLASAADTDGRHDMIDCTQPPGDTTPLHVHTRYEERLWVASGEFTFWAGQERRVARSGDFVFIPTGTLPADLPGDSPYAVR